MRIASRAPVRLIGELAFIDRQPRSASVIAEGDVVTYELESNAVAALLADPGFLTNLTLSSRGSFARRRVPERSAISVRNGSSGPSVPTSRLKC